MKLIDEYFERKEEVHNYFGYVEDWVSIPLEDGRDYYWYLEQDDRGNGRIYFGDTRDEVGTYASEIYTQRFLPKWVYEAEDYTMICTDPCVDGNKFLQIFDNAKRITEKEFQKIDI